MIESIQSRSSWSQDQTPDVEVSCFGTDQEVGVEVDCRVGSPRAVDPNRDAYVGVRRQIAVHAKRDSNIGIGCEEDLPHRHRLQGLFRQMTKHGRGVQSNLGTRGRGKRRCARRSIVPEHVMQWSLEIGVAESFDDDPENQRHLTVDRL